MRIKKLMTVAILSASMAMSSMSVCAAEPLSDSLLEKNEEEKTEDTRENEVVEEQKTEDTEVEEEISEDVETVEESESDVLEYADVDEEVAGRQRMEFRRKYSGILEVIQEVLGLNITFPQVQSIMMKPTIFSYIKMAKLMATHIELCGDLVVKMNRHIFCRV